MTARKKASSVGPTPVDAITHDDTRTNIPTNELRALMRETDAEPTTLRYPRDPSLDPQLVWKGKDEQDADDLDVQVVPIYIQEKIHPRVIIENLRKTAAAGETEPELTLFDDFNGIEFEELVDFYQHEQHWTNRLILGDSVQVMASLSEKERLRGKVQTIYIDPPYGIRFGSNWQVSTRKREVSDGKLRDATRQPEQVRAFRDTWELGIHSYLAYLRDRLMSARELLHESGSIFVQIGDENVHLVRCLLDEVFGSENFISLITVNKTTTTTGDFLAATADYVVWFARDATRAKFRRLFQTKEMGAVGSSKYDHVRLGDGTERSLSSEERREGAPLPAASRIFRLDNLTSPRVRENRTGYFPVNVDDREYYPRAGEWKTNREGMARLLAADRVRASSNSLNYVRFLDDFPAFSLSNIWTDVGGIQSRADPKIYVVQTNPKVIERCLLMTSDPGDLVLDPTCGSGTTAVSAEKWGRRWITIDTSRVALQLARQRIMAYRFPWYDLREGRDVRQGFHYRTVPRVTLKSIAQNPDIRAGMSRQEIDTAIAMRAEQEVLYDWPREDSRRVRVAGPFTVESLSPHHALEPTGDAVGTRSGVDFGTTIFDNLRASGVQNTVKGEHLKFDLLEPFAGRWIAARGAFTDAAGATRSVAVSLGPEYGTVDRDQIREAAKEAVKGAGFDLLLVCAFAFDATAGEAVAEFKPLDGDGWAATVAEQREFGRLPVLLVRMNPDLAMGADLLKKTGTGNLFMVFGEPDITIERDSDGNVEVEVRGLDVYDPTTGQIRASSVDDIACWFIDTNYNEESFFVREAYFTGANDPYASLKKALRADIDEAAWETLYRTRSRPFAIPPTGKIAVKVINHYGDEVMQVYDIAPG